MTNQEPFYYLKSLDYPYRVELLQVIPAFHRHARNTGDFNEGELVYYGPQPAYYGIGEVKNSADGFVAVDFRGTGTFGVHEDIFRPEYLIPIPSSTMSLL